MATSKSLQSKGAYFLGALFLLMVVMRSEQLLDYTLLIRYLLLAAGSLVALGLFWRQLREPSLPLALGAVAFAFWLWQGLSIFWAHNLSEALTHFARLSAPVGFFFLSLALLYKQSFDRRMLVRAGFLAASLLAIITLFQLLQALSDGAFFNDIYALKGSFSHKNLLASAMMLCLPFALLTWAKEKGGWSKIGLGVSLLLVAELFVLRTRGVWLGLILGGLVLTLAFVRFHGKDFGRIGKWVAVFAGLATLILVVLFSSPQSKAGFLNRSNIDKRLAFWDNSWQMIEEHPVLGVGGGNWKLFFPKYGLDRVDRSAMQGITHIQRPHNDYLWLWSEIGPLGVLLYLGLFGFGIVQAWRHLKSDKQEQQAYGYFGLLALVAYGSFSLGDFPLERAPHNLFFFAWLALLFSPAAPPVKTYKVKGLGIGIAVLSVFALYIYSQRWQGEKASVRVLELNKQRNAQAIVPAAQEAVNPFYEVDPYANPLYYYSSMGLLVQNQLDQALEHLAWAKEAAPYNILVFQTYANVWRRRGDQNQALRYLDSALAISPKFETALVIKAEILLEQKRFADALGVLNQHPMYSQDQRFLQTLARALRGSLNTYPEHQRFAPVMEHLKKQGDLREPMDYIQAYRQAREKKGNAGL